MDLNNPVLKLCLEGSRLEYEKRPEDARRVYWQAWEEAKNDYEACIAAHYVARLQTSPEDRFRWNQEALERAGRVSDGTAEPFYPSLYLNMGHSYEQRGDLIEAQRYYELAAKLGYPHQPE